MQKVNNDFYDTYGEKWYCAHDDPVALLRAETKIKTPWVIEKIKSHNFLKPTTQLLDVGCGAGFLSNELAKQGLKVTGIDLSEESLKVAQSHDETKSVHYLVADAYHLPFLDQTFDVLTAMDFLEHVEHPNEIIKEFSRVLKPDGLFIFHTYNRNPFAYLIIIKLVEWFVKNTPKNMHVLHLFIKPSEMKKYCLEADLKTIEFVGIKPMFSTIPFKNLMTGIVPLNLKFEFTKSLMLSYIGIAVKNKKK